MTISEVSRRTGLPAKTIRYYEEIGLAFATERGANGYRYYDEDAAHELSFIKRSRDLGFSIEDTESLLALWRDTGRASADVRALAEQRIADITQKIDELDSMRRALSELVRGCHGDDRPSCPILEDLAKEEQ
jgi:MerR family copper efflux transcriptional regulator